MPDQPDLTGSRKAQIVAQFQQLLDSHLDDFVAGRVTRLYELQEIADQLCLHPVHLSQTIKQVTGHHACYFYEQRIVLEAKKLLADTSLSITEVAHRLDYDASNFTKFFKRFTQMTPSVYRQSINQTSEH